MPKIEIKLGKKFFTDKEEKALEAALFTPENIPMVARDEEIAVKLPDEAEKSMQKISYTQTFFPENYPIDPQKTGTTLNFNKPVFLTPCKKGNLHYDVLGPVLGGTQGSGQASARIILGTIKKQSGRIIYKSREPQNPDNNPPRLAKIPHKFDEQALSRFLREGKFNQRLPYLHSKRLCFFDLPDKNKLGCSLMRQLSGRDLFKILCADRDGTPKLSLKQRLVLSIALCEALAQQMHEQNIVHLDVKPENIIVNFLSDSEVEVYFIDCGLSKDVNEDDRGQEARGSMEYISFEALEGRGTSPASDIMSLALVLGLVWGANMPPLNPKKRKADYNFTNLFYRITGLNDFEEEAIRKLLKGMFVLNPQERTDLISCAGVFREIYKAHYAPPTSKFTPTY